MAYSFSGFDLVSAALRYGSNVTPRQKNEATKTTVNVRPLQYGAANRYFLAEGVLEEAEKFGGNGGARSIFVNDSRVARSGGAAVKFQNRIHLDDYLSESRAESLIKANGKKESAEPPQRVTTSNAASTLYQQNESDDENTTQPTDNSLSEIV